MTQNYGVEGIDVARANRSARSLWRLAKVARRSRSYSPMVGADGVGVLNTASAVWSIMVSFVMRVAQRLIVKSNAGL
jgi:hypothetical protein